MSAAVLSVRGKWMMMDNLFLKEITVSGPDGTQEKIEVPVWNGTAANIILMSLGPRFVIYKH